MIRRLVADNESMRFSTRRLTKNQLTSARPIISTTAQARRLADDGAELLALAEVAADEHAEAARQRTTWTMAVRSSASPA